MDNAKLEDLEERFERINKRIMENSTNMRRSIPNPTEENLRRMAMYPYRDPMLVWMEMDAEARRYEHEETEYVNSSLCTIYAAEKLCYKKELFDGITNVCFEGYQLPAPIGYHEVLRHLYGDYMVCPPVEKRGIWHSNALIDPDVSYKRVQEKLL